MRRTYDINRPEPGFYRTRLVRGGPWVPAVVFIPCPINAEVHWDEWTNFSRRSWQPLCLIDGRFVDALDRWTWLAGREIKESDYNYMMAAAAWDRAHAADSPAANPYDPIDWRSSPIPKVRQQL